MAKVTCHGSINTFTGGTIPCGFGVEGVSNDDVREQGWKHLAPDRYPRHRLEFTLDKEEG